MPAATAKLCRATASAAFTDGEPRQLRIVVGDGRSDFCVAGRADLVLAKGALLDHCRAANMPHLAFADFDEASLQLAGWLEDRQFADIGRAGGKSGEIESQRCTSQ